MTINFGFSVKNHKCFKERGASFHTIKPINLLVGRNNVGKSTFLEILDALCNEEGLENTEFPEVELFETLNERAFWNLDFNEFQHAHLKEAVVCYVENADWPHYVGVDREITESQESILKQRYSTNLFRYEFEGDYYPVPQVLCKKHVRLRADRDIVPEVDDDDLGFTANGVGATKIIHALSHHSESDWGLITNKLLVSLNEIFSPDTKFVEMTTKYHKINNKWEVYLAEEKARLYPLSQSGSGLKTVILVLLNLLVRPVLEGVPVQEYIFSFEELENNLHPSLQRKLFRYLEGFAVKFGCHMFITTHSNIAIDAYSRSPHAQINHIQKDGDEVFGTVISNGLHGYGILSDLGNKASDLLQANGIVWVEGPSDRIYIKKFIEIWSAGTLCEGLHYQFAFFGGSLLAHLDMSLPKSSDGEVLSVLRINRNAILVCDGDYRNEDGSLKRRVVRAKEDLEGSGGYCWVTKCREIENYIPKEAFSAVNQLSDIGEIGPYENILDFLQRHRATRALAFADKVEKAKLYVESFTRRNLDFRPEINEQMTEICRRIRYWNFIDDSGGDFSQDDIFEAVKM